MNHLQLRLAEIFDLPTIHQAESIKEKFSENIMREQVANIGLVATAIARRGWAETNAGNVSVVLPDITLSDSIHYIKSTGLNPMQLDQQYAKLGNRVMLISLSGARYRKMEEFPEESYAVLAFNQGGDAYYALYLPEETKITSECPAHFSSHNVVVERLGGSNAYVHTHPTDFNTFVLHRASLDENIWKKLFRMHPEQFVLYGVSTGLR